MVKWRNGGIIFVAMLLKIEVKTFRNIAKQALVLVFVQKFVFPDAGSALHL